MKTQLRLRFAHDSGHQWLIRSNGTHDDTHSCADQCVLVTGDDGFNWEEPRLRRATTFPVIPRASTKQDQASSMSPCPWPKPAQSGALSWLLRPRPHRLPLLKKIVFLLLQDQNITFTAPQRGFHALVGHFPYRHPADPFLRILARRLLFSLGEEISILPSHWPFSLTPKQHPNLLSVSKHQLELSRRGGGKIGNLVPQAEWERLFKFRPHRPRMKTSYFYVSQYLLLN